MKVQRKSLITLSRSTRGDHLDIHQTAPQSSPRARSFLINSQRRREKGGDRKGIQHHQLLADLQPLAVPLQLIAIEPRCEQPRITFLLGLENTERRFDEQRIRTNLRDTWQADDVPVRVDVIFTHLLKRLDAVFEHRTRVAEDQSRWQIAINVLLRHDLVRTVLGE